MKNKRIFYHFLFPYFSFRASVRILNNCEMGAVGKAIDVDAACRDGRTKE